MQTTPRFRRPLRPLSTQAHHRPLLRRAVLPLWVVSVSVLGLLGCKDLTGSPSLPAGTQNPSTFNTPAGALGMRTAAIRSLTSSILAVVVNEGLLTDELESNETGASLEVLSGSSLPAGGSLDERILPEQEYGASGTGADGVYGVLQQVRGLASQALSALAAYDTGTAKQGDPVAMRSELFALQGFAEIMLADFFCSGVPLSTLDFQKDYTYHAGSTTTQVYLDAIAKLDSAYTLARASDSTRFQDLALVLKGRAWLDLGQYDSAAVAVASVPNGFQYTLATPNVILQGSFSNWVNGVATVSDREGGTGLPYLSSGDPRTAIQIILLKGAQGNNTPSVTFTFPARYRASLSGAGFTPFTVADGIEARLIQAEAALHTNPEDPSWLTILNALRATAPVPGTTQPATALQLPQVADPGDSPGDTTMRVSLLFHERAYWLFLTGHRQGDLRRLIREYGRSQDKVYPVGPYNAPGAGTYGSDVTAPIPGAEYANPLFQGCLSRSA